ncbi:HNH endonuclease [Marinilabilia rubra]|uniref:Uncharacterized protein n=1 Tax=Marinilabilia rubra TaxID=2162893 RepID=A0A2U2B6S5_9BACT|nr:HNH endonuclease signature motif containing protein [Marinilabilia rubra]PWD98781.1 hypothetical protein DDZ16_13665 [Marinilabilia rubra]
MQTTMTLGKFNYGNELEFNHNKKLSMNIYEELKLGNRYSKTDLANKLDQESLKTSREGLYHSKNDNSTLFFVTLKKQGKEDRLHYNDFFEGEFFHWDSQTTQHINSPKIQEIVNGERTVHLFTRIEEKIKGKTQPYVYCGRLQYEQYEEGTSNPVHIVFRSLDYEDNTLNEDLREIYLWKPNKVGKSTQSRIDKSKVVSEERKRNYSKPDETARKGLITSRVGQGYYRQQIIEKWGGVCPVTKCDILEILIASHIVPWNESSDEERLDPENGILLAPHIDALFDKHLISFEDDGTIVISNKIQKHNYEALNISHDLKLGVSENMKGYLKRHRQKMQEKE